MEENYRITICRLIYSLNQSIDEVADKIGASPKSIYKWMNGTSLPNCKHLLALIEMNEASKSHNHNQQL